MNKNNGKIEPTPLKLSSQSWTRFWLSRTRKCNSCHMQLLSWALWSSI